MPFSEHTPAPSPAPPIQYQALNNFIMIKKPVLSQ
nr:MAG TPA: hypothetical protein [Caudoviricetes sp.]